MNTFPPGGEDELSIQKPIEKVKADKEFPEKVKQEKEVPEKIKPEKEHKLEKFEKEKREKEKREKEKPEKDKEGKVEKPEKPEKLEKEKREKENKIEVKEKEFKHEKVEKPEVKETKHEIEKIKPEFEKLEKIEDPEKPIFENPGKQIAEGGGLPGPETVNPALDADTLMAHADSLEQSGRALRHFIERSLRPDLSTGALRNEPDQQPDAGTQEESAKPAPKPKDHDG